MVAVGTVLNGRYRLDRLLGRGGFARVFLATDLGPLGRAVAVKVLSAELAEDPDFLARFAAEAGQVAALDHPNILSVYDYGEVGETAFLVMPNVEGGTLQGLLARRGSLGLAEAAGDLAQAAAALDHAHARGVVHRDVKPANMLLRADGHLFLADFGIAKVVSGTRASTTRAVGTLAYMAPEQLDGQVSRASDVYALGCVLFELLTGGVPYTGPTQRVMRGHVMEPIPSLAELGAGRLPWGLQAAIERALAKEPGQRFGSAGELARGVRAIAEGTSVELPQTEARDANATVAVFGGDRPFGEVTASRVSPSGPSVEGAGSRRALLIGGVTGLVGLLSGAVAVVALSRRADTSGDDRVATNVAATLAAMGGQQAGVAGTVAPTSTASGTGTRTVAAVTVTSVPSAAPATATAMPPTATATAVPPTATVRPTLVPPPIPGAVLYQTDWSDGMTGWSGPSSWKSIGGTLINDGEGGDFNHWLFAPYSPDMVLNYVVEAQIQIVRGNGTCGTSFGLIARAAAAPQAYRTGIVFCDGFYEAAIWYRTSRDDYRDGFTLAKQPISANMNWRTYRLEVNTTTIKLFRDDALVLEAADNRYVTGGRVGLWSVGWQINVRGFKVTAL